MIERPGRSFRYLILHELKIQLIVHVPTNDPRLPIHRKDMEIILQHLPFRQNMETTDPIRARITRSMNGAMHDAGLSADIFHDIDLAACWPANFTKIFTEHPKGWPDALPERELYASLHHPVRKRKFSARKQTGRSKTTRAIPAPAVCVVSFRHCPCCDRKTTVSIQRRILRLIGIVL